MDIKTKLIEALEEFSYPIIQQGSVSSEAEYPESFFTFFNNSAEAIRFYDDDETQILWDFDLNFYSTDPIKVNSTLLDAKAVLRKAGFTVTGAGYDVLSDEPTHTGRGINVLYLQIMEG